MRELVLPPVRLTGGAGANLPAALHAVFGPETLRAVHGPSTRAGMFDKAGQRTVKFKIQVDNVPAPIRRFFCGSELDVTSKQTLEETRPGTWTVRNRVKLHFVGAEFFKLRPEFSLRRHNTPDGGGGGVVTLSGRVRHDAVLPPPLNGIAEGFMCLQSARELHTFAGVLQARGVVDQVPSLQDFVTSLMTPKKTPKKTQAAVAAVKINDDAAPQSSADGVRRSLT